MPRVCPARLIQPDEFIRHGEVILRRTEIIHGEVFKRRWKATFGASPEVISKLWYLCDPVNHLPNGVEPVHILWAMLFLKLYMSESVHAQMVGGVDEKTFRKWSGLFIDLMSYQESKVVSTSRNYSGVLCAFLFALNSSCSYSFPSGCAFASI